ncbi:hypothetical protein C8R44DRAFT_974274 [Mycena epipterygia]|nr:hypothetical protein C8R44DRAFT_974274 [Mycena epipterygia]
MSSLSLSLLPGHPKIFHGREEELEVVVNTLLKDSPRISILGTGGIGKTSLATAALHRPEVGVKYSNRYFVACHSTPTCADLVSSIGAHIGLDKGSKLAHRICSYLLHSPPALLVLDNFETPWESTASRSETEEFLSLLGDVPHLAVLITMRGSERPGKIKWTRPFLEPLQPLPDSAALETFLDITDDRDANEGITELLNLTGNLPLAVTLMASVASYEGCATALSRWKVEKTRLLSDGYDQRSNLDISIMLSFSSSRMTLAAQDLLAALSMLPDGFSDADLIESKLPIADVFTCKATLIRTALAYTDNTGRLKTLVPIQEHIRQVHPLPQKLRLHLRRHFQDILERWTGVNVTPSNEIVTQISLGLGNFHTVLLRDGGDRIQTMESIIYLNRFYRNTRQGWCPLLATLASTIEPGGKSPIYGKYLIERLTSSNQCPMSDPDSHIAAGNQYFAAGSDLDNAAWDNALGIYYDGLGDLSTALRHHKTAFALATAGKGPAFIAERALASRGISGILSQTGAHLEAYQYAKRAEAYETLLGDVQWQAAAISMQASCCIALADFRTAQALCVKAIDLLKECGLQNGVQGSILRSHRAHIHLLKTEYMDARQIVASLARPKFAGIPFTQSMAFAHHNLAVLDIALGASAELVLRNLAIARDQFNMTRWSLATARCDATRAALHLREGEVVQAKEIFERSFTALHHKSTLAADFCLERLADVGSAMHDPQGTSKWTVIYIASSFKTRNRLAIAKVLHLCGKLFVTFDDDETALSLFRIALDGFESMEIHQHRADCLSRMTTILDRRGDAYGDLSLD